MKRKSTPRLCEMYVKAITIGRLPDLDPFARAELVDQAVEEFLLRRKLGGAGMSSVLAARYVLARREESRTTGRDPTKSPYAGKGLKSREVQAAAAGCSARLIQDAHSLPDADLELVAAGKATVPEKVRKCRDAAKDESLRKAAENAERMFGLRR